MESKAAVKVGVAALIGLALFAGVYWFLSHGMFSWTHYRLTVVFDDTKGLVVQTPVRMNGVVIGEVESIKLSSSPGIRLHPVVTLAISNDYLDRIPDDSTIAISSGLLITNPQVDITPGVSGSAIRPGQTWARRYVAVPTGALAQLSPEANQAINQLVETLKLMTPKLSHTMDRVQGILNRTDAVMANLEGTTASAKRLLTDPRIRRTMYASLDDLEAMTHSARESTVSITRDLKTIVHRNGAKFDELANGAVDLLQRLGDTVDAARSALTRLTEQVSDPRLQQSLLETLDLAKSTVARFNQIASDIHEITGDTAVQSDLKTALTQLRETTEEVRPIVTKLGAIVGALPGPGARPRLGIGRPEFAIDFLARANSPHFRSDVTMRLPVGGRNAFDLGFHDFAEHNRLDAQYETLLGRSASLRYGLYSSKLGAGFGWEVSPASRLVLDLYDPNNLRFDARALIGLNSDFSLWLGADSLFKRTTPLIGVRLQR